MEKPAIEGGKPVRDSYLPYVKHLVGEEEIKAATDALKSDLICGGPKAEEFEQALAKYLGCKRVVSMNSCTAALHTCLLALGIKQGDEVITSNLTFAATPSVSSMVGASPIVADIYEDTFNINPEEIRKNITPRTKVIMPVHYGGQPCEMDEIMKIAKENNLEVIEDAAHAISAEYKGKKIGCIGKAACFSFHPVKNMTLAGGGAIATNDEEFADKCKLIRLHGLDKYRMLVLGYNYPINDISAAVGLVQLKKLESFEAKRAEYANMYLDAFKDMPEIITPVVRPEVKPSWHLFVIRLNLDKLKITRDKFREALKAENIGTQVHFVPINQQPYYQKSFENKSFPATEKVYNSIMAIPLFPKMEKQDVLDVINAVKKIVEYYRK